jgi:hypothetical protein
MMGADNRINRLTDADRERARGKIQLGMILKRLGDTALGKDSMKSDSLRAAQILLDKALPNLQSISMQTSPDLTSLRTLNTNDLVTLIAAMNQVDALEHEPDMQNTHTMSSNITDCGQNNDDNHSILTSKPENGVDSTFQGGYSPDSGLVDGGGRHVQFEAGVTKNTSDDSSIPDVNQVSTVKEQKEQEQSGNKVVECRESKLTVSDLPVKNNEVKRNGNSEGDAAEDRVSQEVHGTGTQAPADPIGEAQAAQEVPNTEDDGAGSQEGQLLDAEIAAMEDEIRQMQEELNGTNDGNGSIATSEEHAPAGTGNLQKPVKGGFIPPKSRLASGKLR